MDDEAVVLIRSVAHAVNLMFRNVLLGPDALHRKQSILRAAIALFADPRFFAPQVAVNRVALGNFVVAEALRKAHASAVGEFAQQSQHLPLEIRRWLLLRIAEED